MSFIEHMAHDDWANNFRVFFEGTLSSLEDDPHMYLGSAMGDLRAWLTIGGISRLRYTLIDQMRNLHYPPEKQEAILHYLAELVKDNRIRLLKLADKGIIPRLSALGDAPVEVDTEDMIRRLLAGERPFEEWMYEQGYTTHEIEYIYQQIDRCLWEHGLIEPASKRLH